MDKTALITALMAACPLPDVGGEGVPEWIQLLPTSSGQMQTRDARGPYIVEDAEAIIAASMAEKDRFMIDECHAADKGEIARARGWVEEMEARSDGIWARVSWNPSGVALLEDRAYRGISPVILHDKSKRVVAILRASLTNTPNLRGMVALNQEDQMTLIERLAELLGLGAEASEDDVFAAVEAKLADVAEACVIGRSLVTAICAFTKFVGSLILNIRVVMPFLAATFPFSLALYPSTYFLKLFLNILRNVDQQTTRIAICQHTFPER